MNIKSLTPMPSPLLLLSVPLLMLQFLYEHEGNVGRHCIDNRPIVYIDLSRCRWFQCSSSSASHDDFDDEKLCVLLEGGQFPPAPMLGTAQLSVPHCG